MIKSVLLDDFYGIKIRKGQYGEQDKNVVREVVQADGYKLDARHLMPLRPSLVIDIGAHIGSFAKMWHLRNPAAKIVCVEVCPENWDILDVNTALIASVEHAACTYEPGQVVLHNSIMAGGSATGGSILSSPDVEFSGDYWRDDRPIRKTTLEELIHKHQFPRIDCLKLDCEGSEFSILEHATCLDKVGFICGEYHDSERWRELISRKFGDWSHCYVGGQNFHLQNPRWETDFKPMEE